MNRREALRLAMGAVLAGGADEATAAAFLGERSAIPIIDCHVHLFDTSRPGGVPWPDRTDTVLYRPALPARYARIVRPLGVKGAIAIEASPLQSDNDWVLQQAANHPMFVGMVGDLAPGAASYAADLDRLRANPLFLGIRYGNLWGRDLFADSKKPGFIADLRRLATCGLAFDSANPDPRLIRALLEITDQVPELRIVIDHLPNATLPDDASVIKEYWNNVRRLGQNDHVFMKLSEVPVRGKTQVPADLPYYKENLDRLWNAFGEDRVLFGSDWPNSDHVATYAVTLDLVRGYVSAKGQDANEKFFWKNSLAAYRWRRRVPDQPVA